MNHIYQKDFRNPRDWQTMRLTSSIKNPHYDGRKKIGGGQFKMLDAGTLWEVFHEPNWSESWKKNNKNRKEGSQRWEQQLLSLEAEPPTPTQPLMSA